MKNWLQNLSNTIFYDIHFSDFAMKWRTESVITKGKEFEWNDSNELRHFFIFMRLNIMLDFRMNNSTDEIKYASKTVFRRDHKLWFITIKYTSHNQIMISKGFICVPNVQKAWSVTFMVWPTVWSEESGCGRIDTFSYFDENFENFGKN